MAEQEASTRGGRPGSDVTGVTLIFNAVQQNRKQCAYLLCDIQNDTIIKEVLFHGTVVKAKQLHE